jgi:DNA-damage-inducible protein J
MSKTAIVRARVDEDVKKDTEKIFKELGFTMSDAINIFLRRCRVKKGIPFELEIPNAETIKVFEDTDNGIGLNRCDSVKQLFKELKEK